MHRQMAALVVMRPSGACAHRRTAQRRAAEGLGDERRTERLCPVQVGLRLSAQWGSDSISAPWPLEPLRARPSGEKKHAERETTAPMLASLLLRRFHRIPCGACSAGRGLPRCGSDRCSEHTSSLSALALARRKTLRPLARPSGAPWLLGVEVPLGYCPPGDGATCGSAGRGDGGSHRKGSMPQKGFGHSSGHAMLPQCHRGRLVGDARCTRCVPTSGTGDDTGG
jgi:hypothetical protein